MVASGSLFALYFVFARDIYVLINESGLDIFPVKKTFCKSISVIGLIFIIQLADLLIIFLEFVTERVALETGKDL